MGVGYLITAFSSIGATILVGYMIYSIGYSFYSGADDALMYDQLKKYHKEDEWKQVANTKNFYSRSAAVFATIAGGLLFALNIRLPSIVRGLFFLLMLLPLIHLPENYGFTDPEKSIKKYLTHIADGTKQLFLPSIRNVLPLLIVVGSVTSVIYVGGILRPLLLERAGYGGSAQSYIIGIAGVITLLILWIHQNKLKKLSSGFVIWISSIILLFSFGALGVLPSHLWLPMLFIIQILQGIFTPVTSEFVNQRIPSSHRATTLSALSLTQNFPYILVAPLLGVLADQGKYLFMIWGIGGVILISLLLSLLLHSKGGINQKEKAI